MLFIDEILFKTLFNLAYTNESLGRIMVVTTNWSSKVFALIYLIGIVTLFFKNRKMLLPFILAPATAFIGVRLIRYFYVRPRPFVALNIDSLIYHAANGSLPSMHAVSAFVIGMAIWHVNRKLGSLVLILASITGLSRVMVGVHYPLDIILGALIAITISKIIFKWLDSKDNQNSLKFNFKTVK